MSQLYIRPFGPVGNTVNLAVTGTTDRVAVTRSGIGTQSIRVLNIGTQTVFINIGSSTVTAALATSMPVFPGTVETFLLKNDQTHVAAIASAAGSTIYITTGESA